VVFHAFAGKAHRYGTFWFEVRLTNPRAYRHLRRQNLGIEGSTVRVLDRFTRVLALVIIGLPVPVASRAQPVPSFAGSWQLVSYESRDSAGKVEYPWGKDAIGRLSYDAGNNMAAQIMRRGQPPFASQDLHRGTDAEVRAAFDGFIAYWGTYTIDPLKHTITHHVLGGSYPNWVGGDQVRYYKLDGPRLVLSTPPIRIGGRLLTSVLVWERVP
jgi:hypothetical protein